MFIRAACSGGSVNELHGLALVGWLETKLWPGEMGSQAELIS
jgi:hypothetical protein